MSRLSIHRCGTAANPQTWDSALSLPVLAVDVIVTTYVRLAHALMDSSRRDHPGPIADAWAIIDWAHRLRVVVSQN